MNYLFSLVFGLALAQSFYEKSTLNFTCLFILGCIIGDLAWQLRQILANFADLASKLVKKL